MNSSTFPQEIKDLSFVEMMHITPVRAEYDFAIYQNESGERFVCKLWSGQSKGQSWKDLINEIAVYEALNKISTVTTKKIAARFPTIQIPKLFTYFTSDSLVYLVTEFMEGTFLSKTASKQKALEAYSEAIEYFHTLSTVPAFIAAIPEKRSPLQFYANFHIQLLHALLRFPSQAGLLFRSILPFYRGIGLMFERQETAFVHRDLGGYNNIMVQADKYTILDFQLSCITHPLVEVANIVATKKKDTAFTKVFFASELWEKIKANTEDFAVFCALFIYATVLNIATEEQEEAEMSLPLLERALTL